MYTLVYRRKETEGSNIVKSAYTSGDFRLKKNALHYLWEIVQNEYREMGYATEIKVGGLYCYTSCKHAQGERKIIEEWIKVEKY
jgi:hypothetical protein